MLAEEGKYDIYIPIWLDLLFMTPTEIVERGKHLHSNMVRFIIGTKSKIIAMEAQFTFQYG